jgi:pyrimidine deaminase RibD-like protein
MPLDDRECIRLAIDASKRCKSEPHKISPMVGAAVVKDGRLLAVAHRGERAPGDHAEFTVMETILGGEVLAGATVYTTLEPCTTRNHPKVPCAMRLIERKIARVVVQLVRDPRAQLDGRHGTFGGGAIHP